MKILIIGGKGTIGKTVTEYLKQDHEVLIAGRTSGDFTVDIADSNSVEQLFSQIGELDAIVCIAGEAKWADFDALTEEDYYIGLRSKLMGQVNLVRLGRQALSPGGSITLSTGILADDPVVKTASAAMVNGGIHSFVQAAALESNGKYRLNVVSLGLVEDAYERYKDYFPGHTPISMRKAVDTYVKSIMGKENGKVFRTYS